MAEAVLMPRLGQSVETCIITKWFKNKGDIVNAGDLLFSYETDKASFEETAQTSGILLDIYYNEGDEVPVLTNVAVIGKKGESTEAFNPDKKPSEDIPDSEDKTDNLPVDERTHEKEGIIKDINEFPGIKISPRARNMAADHKIDTGSVKGSGPNGRIIARDIEKLINEAVKHKPTPSVKEKSFVNIEGQDFTITPLTNLRKIISASMFSSLQNSAQLTHHLGADARRILSLREKIKNEKAKINLPNITINDMVCFALVKALVKLPHINAHFSGDSIKIFHKVHLGIAVDTERGLMVPVLKNADDYSLRGLSVQLKELSDTCRKGNIDPDLLKSDAASFTVSNLGSYGIELFTPVLNLPQVGILGINTISYRPADIGGGVIGLVPFIGLSLTYDHRAIDGAPASAFLKEVKQQIEQFDDTII